MMKLREKILVDDDYFKELKEQLQSAENKIDLEAYIFELDNVGKQIFNLLCVAAKRGVAVRLLLDGVGSREWNTTDLVKAKKSGVRVRIFHPLPWRFWQWHHHNKFKSIFEKIFYLSKFLNSRTHRKYCIIDDKVVFIGSANISGAKKIGDHHVAWHNITAQIQNADLTSLQYAFDKAWGVVSLRRRLRDTFSKINLDPLFRLNHTFRLRRKLYKDLLHRFGSAKKRIWITTPYFVPKTSLIKNLIKAARVGTEVVIVLPKRSDITGMKILIRSYYPLLLKAGVKIYEHKKGLLHTKMLIIDDWFTLGSSNLNYRSLYYDLEVDVNIRLESAKKALEEQFNDYCLNGESISLADTNKQSVREKLFAKLLLLFKYWF